MMYQCLDKSHLLPRVLHDDDGILGGTAKEVGGKHHGEVAGVHLGDADNIRADENLEEPDEETQDNLMKLWKPLDKRTRQICVLSHPHSVSIKVVI